MTCDRGAKVVCWGMDGSFDNEPGNNESVRLLNSTLGAPSCIIYKNQLKIYHGNRSLKVTEEGAGDNVCAFES